MHDYSFTSDLNEREEITFPWKKHSWRQAKNGKN